MARHVLTILAVEALPAAVRFYREAFGWSQTVDAPVYVEFELPGGMRFGVYERHAFGRNTGQVPAPAASGQLTSTELYFHVDDLDATIASLRKAGARELSPLAPREWGDEVAYFADPDGNVLAIARPLAPS